MIRLPIPLLCTVSKKRLPVILSCFVFIKQLKALPRRHKDDYKFDR